MSVTKPVLFVSLFGLYVSLAAFAENQAPVRRPVVKAQQATTQAAAAPALTPAQMPAAPPQVSFQNGMLTIVSQNSTLGDILRAVHARTGAAMDIPPNATERVVARLGPGPARDVLAALLNGSHFNYVLLGSATDANALDRVLLTPKSAASTTEAAVQPPPAPPQAAPDDDEDEADMETDDEEDTQADTGAGQGEDQAQQVQPAPGQPGLPNVRTPEQMLQQMRQRQLQQGMPAGQPYPGQPYPGQTDPNQTAPQPPN